MLAQAGNSFDVRRSMLDVRCSRVQNERTPSPAEFLESAIAARRKSQTELSDLRKLLADKSAQQAALETTGDLHNPAVLAEIGRLQIFTELLPRRIAAKENDDLKSEASLTQATNQFIREHLGPRVRRLAARTRAAVEAQLSPHFPDAAALIVAVAGSERVRSVAGLDWSASINPVHGAIAHAEGALKSWRDADKFENQLESNCSAKLHSLRKDPLPFQSSGGATDNSPGVRLRSSRNPG
jgi:hypothetical protein